MTLTLELSDVSCILFLPLDFVLGGFKTHSLKVEKSQKNSLIMYSQKKTTKFIYFEKATKFCEISIVDLSYEVPVKSAVEILQSFVAFSEYMNRTKKFSISAPTSEKWSNQKIKALYLSNGP